MMLAAVVVVGFAVAAAAAFAVAGVSPGSMVPCMFSLL